MDRAARITARIDQAYAEVSREREARSYIGASIVGNECDAYLALSLRGFPNDEPQPRNQRIFKLGHRIEDMVVDDLRKAGVFVWEVDPLTGKQHAMVEWNGHVVAHADGHLQLDPKDDRVSLLEVKSMNAKSFGNFRRNGVQKSHPSYYAQVQMMLAMGRMSEALFIAYCKDNSEYHAEIVEYDEYEWAILSTRVERVLNGSRRRISNKPDDWRCKGCFKRTVCQTGEAPPNKSIARVCKTCVHAVAQPDGGWLCTKHARQATEVCADYELFRPLGADAKEMT